MEMKRFLNIVLVFVGLTFTMNAHAQQISYQWSTGDTTANFSANPSVTTTYYVTVTQYGVSYVDSFTLVVNPVTTTPVAAAICAGDTFTSVGGQQLTGAGVYTDSLIASTGCDSIVQTTLTVNPLPVVSFAQDTILSCGVDSTQLDAGAGFASYAWSTGDTIQNPFIAASGMYFVTVTNSGGCEAVDSVYVSLINAEIAQEDTAICVGDSLTLSVFETANSLPITNSILVVPVAYSSIQAAIDNASNGDTIYVQNGVYYENINYDGKNITVEKGCKFFLGNGRS